MTNFISKPIIYTIASVLLALFFATTLAGEIPESYDLRELHPQCMRILNQGNCGSCWAFSATQALTDRFCIATNGTSMPDLVLSPQYQVNCDTSNSACQGGLTLGAYKFMQHSGVDTLSCTEYVSGTTGRAGRCVNKCDSDANQFQLSYSSSAYSLVGRTLNDTITNIQRDIMNYGSVSVSFIVYTDFVSFFSKNPKGIYKKTPGATARGGHAVKAVGWGVSDDSTKTPYWIIANSWGEDFGDNGYFKIVRGQDDSNIESRAVTAGVPKIDARHRVYNGKIPSYATPAEMVNNKVVDGGFDKIEITEEIGQMFEQVIEREGINRKRAIGIMSAYSQVTNGQVNFKLEIAMNKGPTNEVKMATVIINKDHKDNFNVVNMY